jgi:transposase
MAMRKSRFGKDKQNCLMEHFIAGVLDISDFKHYRINHSKLFADKRSHINGIENFWNQAERHMRKFNGVPKNHFSLFLKECK